MKISRTTGTTDEKRPAKKQSRPDGKWRRAPDVDYAEDRQAKASESSWERCVHDRPDESVFGLFEHG